MSEQLLEKYGKMPILFAGGVMSNKIMRAEISSRFEAYFSAPEFSADNAAGVARICWKKAKEKEIL
jgi:N6-L-threonylcarbamoyladenine synthase